MNFSRYSISIVASDYADLTTTASLAWRMNLSVATISLEMKNFVLNFGPSNRNRNKNISREDRRTYPILKDVFAPAVITTTSLPKSLVNSVKSTVAVELSRFRSTAYVSCPGRDLKCQAMEKSIQFL